MLHTGENLVRDIPVTVVRKRIRRVNIRIAAGGGVRLSVPLWGATLARAEAFLLSKWAWVEKARAASLARAATPPPPPPSAAALAGLEATLTELMAIWTRRLGEGMVQWKLRRMKSIWGSCHIRKRVITYNSELARTPRELVEYIVVHELSHLKEANHGPAFRALMTQRLPDWPVRRASLRRYACR